jgi:hypothetical protein
MTVRDIIEDVSRDLNDQEQGYEYTRWSVAQLQTYLSEALINDSYLLKDLFHTEKVVRLRPGGDWQKVCDCSEIIRIVGECTEDGEVYRFFTRTYDDERLNWPGSVYPMCTNPDTDEPFSYAISSVDVNRFKVMPPVAPGQSRFVLLQCYKMPTGRSLTENVPDEMVAIVKQWMLYRALIMDSENSPTISTIAGTHLTTHDNLLKRAVDRREKEKAERERDADNLRAVRDQTTR